MFHRCMGPRYMAHIFHHGLESVIIVIVLVIVFIIVVVVVIVKIIMNNINITIVIIIKLDGHAVAATDTQIAL